MRCKYIDRCPGGDCPGTANCRTYKSAKHAARYAANREQILAREAKYRQTHTEEKRARDAKYRQTHAEDIKAHRNDMKANHPERKWASDSLSRHRKDGYIVELTKEELIEMYFATPRCRYCGVKLEHGDGCSCPQSPTLDRVENSETITRHNSQIICSQCNTTKGARSHAEFMLYIEEVRQRVREENPQLYIPEEISYVHGTHRYAARRRTGRCLRGNDRGRSAVRR